MGDLNDGELEIGQIAFLLNSIKSAEAIVNEIITEFNIAKKTCLSF